MTNRISHQQNRFQVIRDDEAAIQLTVGPAPAESDPIPPRLFGNFFEHLGFAAQGGVLAQLLMNPSMFARHNVPREDLDALLENGRIAETLHRLDEEERSRYANWRPYLKVTGFGLLILDDETEHGVPLPWKATPRGVARGRQPGRIGHSVVLELEHGARLSQGVFVPHRREQTYEGYLWLRAMGSGDVRVTMRRRPGVPSGDRAVNRAEIVAETAVSWPGDRWTKCPFSLEIPGGALDPLEPVDFSIEVEGNGQFWVDQAVLLPADHLDGLDPDVVEVCRWLAPPILRGPGGNFVSGYHFWHGIGNLDRRQTFPNDAWGGIDDNFFGTDEFLRLCQLIDAEPHFCVNMGDGTAEEAADWVEYVNGASSTTWGRKRAENGHPEPYGVSMWEVGNEIYGPWQTGHCGAEENARRYREWAERMRAVDPEIELLATGSCFDFIEPEHQWHRILLEEGGEHLASIALHALPNNVQRFTDHTPAEHIWRALMAHTARWETMDLPQLMELAHEIRPDAGIDISVTEWGILGRNGRPEVGNIGGAVYAGLFLNMAIRMQEWIRVANATALLHGGCIRKAGPFVYYDPQIEVIQRYTQLAGGTALPVTYRGPGYDISEGARTAPAVQDVPYLDVVAVQNQQDGTDVVIVSRHPQRVVTAELELEGNQARQPVSCEVMTAEGMANTNTPLAPDQVTFKACGLPNADAENRFRLRIEPRSVTWLRFE